MNRIVEIELFGHTWPLCMTLMVFSNVCDRYGSVNDCTKRLKEVLSEEKKDEKTGEKITVREEDSPALIEEYTWMLAELMLGGWHRVKAERGEEGAIPPGHQTIRNSLSPVEIPDIIRKVWDAVNLGIAREVGAEAPKNGEGPAEGQAQND